MHKDQRLRHRNDFKAAYREGRVHGNRLLVLRVRPNGLDTTRFGFVAGKAVGSAVVRNRVKRRLRAAASELRVRAGLDIVIGARVAAGTTAYAGLGDALAKLLRAAGALLEPSDATGQAR
jgi:ribonuclease P protein component